jgi:hypothetical protein
MGSHMGEEVIDNIFSLGACIIQMGMVAEGSSLGQVTR